MSDIKIPGRKKLFLAEIGLVYILAGVIVLFAISFGIISKLPPDHSPERSIVVNSSSEVGKNLRIAQEFTNKNLVRGDGHVNLYYSSAREFEGEHDTNSEAMSYYLFWNAREGNKHEFNTALNYIEEKMMHPELDYLMWYLDENGIAENDKRNIASDADLRAIKALMIAEERWGNESYTDLINSLAGSLERVAITPDKKLAPYGGFENGEIWMAQNEVWLSYSDFEVFSELAKRRGEPWKSVYFNMKKDILNAQLENGLYNSVIKDGKYGNSLDSDHHSINSLWIMVRSAESRDPELIESARKALEFYKMKYTEEGFVSISYNSNGNSVIKGGSPWAYALVARAAVNLGDKKFADQMISELVKMQNLEGGEFYGSFTEETEHGVRAGQFTMQETIITLQDYLTVDSG